MAKRKLKPLKKYAGGGEIQPYITHDPNDPRIQAYRDSSGVALSQYQRLIKARNEIKPEIEHMDKELEKNLSLPEKASLSTIENTRTGFNYKPKYKETYYKAQNLENDLNEAMKSKINAATFLTKAALKGEEYNNSFDMWDIYNNPNFSSSRGLKPVGFYSIGDPNYKNSFDLSIRKRQEILADKRIPEKYRNYIQSTLENIKTNNDNTFSGKPKDIGVKSYLNYITNSSNFEHPEQDLYETIPAFEFPKQKVILQEDKKPIQPVKYQVNNNPNTSRYMESQAENIKKAQAPLIPNPNINKLPIKQSQIPINQQDPQLANSDINTPEFHSYTGYSNPNIPAGYMDVNGKKIDMQQKYKKGGMITGKAKIKQVYGIGGIIGKVISTAGSLIPIPGAGIVAGMVGDGLQQLDSGQKWNPMETVLAGAQGAVPMVGKAAGLSGGIAGDVVQDATQYAGEGGTINYPHPPNTIGGYYPSMGSNPSYRNTPSNPHTLNIGNSDEGMVLRAFPGKMAQGGPINGITINAEHNELIIDPKTNKVISDLKNLPPHPQDDSKIDPRGTMELPKEFEGKIIIPKAGKNGRQAFLDAKKTNNQFALNRIKRNLTNNQDIMDAQDNASQVDLYAGKGGSIHINPANKGKFNATKARTGKTTEELTHSSNPVTKKRAVFAQNARKWKHEDGGIIKAGNGYVVPQSPYRDDQNITGWNNNTWLNAPYGATPVYGNQPQPQFQSPYQSPQLNKTNPAYSPTPRDPRWNIPGTVTQTHPQPLGPPQATPYVNPNASNYRPQKFFPSDPSAGFVPKQGNNPGTYQPNSSNPYKTAGVSPFQKDYLGNYTANAMPLKGAYPEDKQKKKDGNGGNFNVGKGLLNNVGNLYQLGNALFNKEQTKYVANPYEKQGLDQLANRSYNINPLLASNNATWGSQKYALKQGGMGGSEMRNNLTSALTNKYMADANAYATKNNADNQYKGEYGQALLQQGEMNRNQQSFVNTSNEQNNAKRQDMIGSSLGSIGSNLAQQGNDNIRMNLLPILFPNLGTNGADILKQLTNRTT